jgi:hypothetical protein
VINSIHVTGLTRLDMRPQLGGMKAKWPNRRRKPSENRIPFFFFIWKVFRGGAVKTGSSSWRTFDFVDHYVMPLTVVCWCFGTGAAQFLQLLRSLEKEDVSGQISALSDQVRAYFLPPMTPPIHSSAAVPTSSS